MGMRTLLLLCCLSSAMVAYKILVITPQLANSQVIWNKRVSEELSSAGHDVTMLRVAMYEKELPEVKVDKRVRNVFVNATGGRDGEKLEKLHSKSIYKDLPPWDPKTRAAMNLMTAALHEGCEDLISNKTLMAWLKAEKFDLAFSHMYHPCPIGVIHAAGIPSWVWLNSGGLMDFVADAIGAPMPPSYIPPIMMEASDRMSFFERTKSFIGHQLMKIIYPKMFVNEETAMFRKHFGDDFPDLLDLQRKCPLVMVNSNELYEFTRPTLHKIVNIGGLGMKFEDAKPLAPEFEKIVASAKKGVVVFSFGSVAPSHLMPDEWKDSLLSAFSQFPDYQFVMRYAGSDLASRLPPNVHAFKWLPQMDLMQNPKTKALIAHGGYNSLQEAVSAGIPMVTIPLFGDQWRNGKLVEAKGLGVRVPKGEVSKESISNALGRVLGEESFSLAARRLSQMVRRKPVSPSHLLVKWTEFLAEFKTLENLVPAGSELNMIQYHSLDVIALLATVLIVVLHIIYFVLRAFLRCCGFCRVKSSKKKTE